MSKKSPAKKRAQTPENSGNPTANEVGVSMESVISETPQTPQTPVSSWLLRAQAMVQRIGARNIAIVFSLLVLAVGGYFGYRYWNFINLAPTAVAGNFSMEYKKIPYNVPSIDVTFSHDIDPASVNANSVRIYPFVTGNASLKNPRTVSYALGNHLEIGKKYLLQFTTDIKSARGTHLANEISYDIEAIGGVAVSKMIPEGDTTALSKNPIFIFNIPVLPLGSLESRDKLPCPVKFTPDIPGRCTWPSGNILEYRIDGQLDASTAYQAHVELGSEFLFPMEKPFDGTFNTTRLRVLTGSLDDIGIQRFSPKDGIPLAFTAPVELEALSKILVLKNEKGEVIKHKVIPSIPGETAGTSFAVTGESGPLAFGSVFSMSVPAGLMPKPGNIALVETANIAARSNSFVLQTYFMRTKWTSTGAVEHLQTGGSDGIIPPDRPFISFMLDEPVDLAALGKEAAWAVVLRDTKTKKEYACVLAQPETSVPEFPDSVKMVMKPNHQQLDCQISETLPFDTQMEIVFNTVVSKSIREPVVLSFPTAKDFTIHDIVLSKATELCIYSTATIEYSGSGVTISPNAKLRDITYNYYRNDSSGERTCPERPGEIASIAEVRLDGGAKYDFHFTNELTDNFGTHLAKPFEKLGLVAPALRQQDKYLYFMPDKPQQVIPMDAPIVLPLQTVNLDSINVQVCSMTPGEYEKYLNYQYDTTKEPSCESTFTKKIPVKNGKWNLVTQRIDIAQDVIGGALPGNILLVRGSADGSWNHDYTLQQDFRVVYRRANLSLMMDRGSDRGIIFATDFDGKKVPSDLKFEAYDSYGCDPDFVKSIRFNAEKQYYEWNATKLSGACRVVVAKNAEYYGIVATAADETSNYDFGQYGGADSSDRQYVYLHTDRPIYRAGDTVHFQGILRNFAATGYVKSTAKEVKLRILNNQNELFKEVVTKVDDRSDFNGSVDLTAGMPTGRYSFEVLAYEDNANSGYGNYVVNDGNFYVEQYSKPTFKTEVTGGARHLYEGDSIDATATATYYFGGRVANAPAVWNLTAQNYYFDPKNYSEYRFGTDSTFMECRYWGTCSNHDMYLGRFEKTLDAAGTSTIKYSAELLKTEAEEGVEQVGTPDAKKELLVTLGAEVKDPNTGKSVTGTDSHIVHVTDGYVGIASPYWIEKDAKIQVKGVTLDVDSNVRSAKVKVELIQLQWNSVKKLGVDGVYYNEYELKKTLETTENVSSSKDGKFQLDLTPKAGGEYVIRASYTGKNGAAYVSDSYSYVATDKYSLWNTGNNSVTELTAEKTMVQPGETAVFTLKSPIASGKIIYTVEKDDAILDAKVVDITGYGQKIEVPVLATYIPNVYVRAYLIGRDDKKGLPVYKRALSQLRVLPDSKKLNVEVSAEKTKYLPGETLKVTVAVKDADGNPVPNAVGALSVVDESVLALLGNPEKNPFAFFYDMKRFLGTSVSVSLLNLVEKLEVKNAGNGEKGGAGEGNKGGDTKKKRGVFKDTAFWTGKFTTDAQGNAVIDTGKLPDNLTTWKIEAVISNDATQIGAGRTSVTTEQKVMVQENFPRFLRTGDRTDFAPVIFNRTGKRQRFTVEMQAKGAQVTPSKQEIALDDGASVPALFEVSGTLDANANSAPVELSVTATAESGETDGVQKTLALFRGETYETTAFIGTVEGAGIGENLDLTGVKDGGTLTLTTAPSLLGNVLTGLDSLVNYPYGCLEQITSTMVPSIAVKNIHDALGVPYDLKTVKVKYYDSVTREWQDKSVYDTMTDYAVKLLGYRLSSGGFGYWSSNTEYAEFELTAYAMNTLADIRDLGIPVDQSLSKGAVDYLKARLQKGIREGCVGPEKDCQYTMGEKLEAVTAITKWSADGIDGLKAYKALGDTNSGLENRLDTLGLLAELTNHKGVSEAEKTALRKTANADIDAILKSNIVYDPRGAYIAPDNGSSRTLATAKFIRAVSLLGEDSGTNRQMLDNASRFLVRAKQPDNGYGSTLETATVLRAFAARTSHDSELTKANFDAKGTIAGKEVYSKHYDRQNLLDSTATQIDIKNLSDRESLNLGTNGVGRLYYDLSLKYPVPADKVAARDEGFFVQTTMYDYLEYQKIEKDKAVEFERYSQGKARYSELKYPKEVREYLKPITGAKVGQLVRVEYRVITSETRDKVAFEAFIPAGSELVNTRLSTETKTVTSDTFFDREDLLDDRYFAYSRVLPAGEYSGSYALRFTHAGTYMIPATRISEFYTPEVFGQTVGGVVEVK